MSGFFLFENFPFLVVKFSIYLNRHVFVICSVGSPLCGLVAACCEVFRFFFLFFFLFCFFVVVFFSCSLSYCCVSWILSSTLIILFYKSFITSGPGCFAFPWSVACVLSVILGLFALPFGVISKLWSVIVSVPGHPYYYLTFHANCFHVKSCFLRKIKKKQKCFNIYFVC